MLKNKLFQEKMDRDGYLVTNFFSEEEMHDFIAGYESLHNFDIGEEIFFSNQHHADKDYQDKARHLIRSFFESKINDFFEDAAWMEAVFIVKPPKAGMFSNHQDWTLVDEELHRSCSIWCPMLDVSAANGAFCILEGSHRFFKSYRSPSIRSIYHEPALEAIINTHKKVLPIKKGDVLIFDHACVHSTNPNLSSQRRGAVSIGIRPAVSPIHHYFYHKDTDRIEGFEVDGDFFYNYDYVSRPNYKSLGFVNFEKPQITPAALLQKIRAHQRKKWNVVKNFRYSANGVKA
jgi:hypothetical protein